MGIRTIEQLREQLRGEVVTPGDAGYEDARKVYNAMIDRRPAAVVRCVETGDVSAAVDFAREHGRKVGEIMTHGDLWTATEDMPLDEVVRLMERNNVKRLPVVRGDTLVGIVTRSDLLRAVASLARDVPDPTADDDHIRSRVVASIEKNDWQPMQLGVTVRDGIVHLTGMITDERFRQAAIVAAENVAGVKLVHDHLYFLRRDVRTFVQVTGRRGVGAGRIAGQTG